MASRFPQVGDAFGPYQLSAQLGQGHAGAVFLASIRSGDEVTDVALKVIRPRSARQPGFRDRFLGTTEAVRSLEEAHLVRIHDLGEQDGCLYLATELVPGGDLATRLVHSALPASLASTLAEQVAGALAAAHRQGIVHGNLTPSNVLLTQREGRPTALVTDFGILPVAGVVGLEDYRAPELADGSEPTVATDVYALGCVLVAAVTGAPPYRGTDREVAEQHRTGAVPTWEETGPAQARLNHLVGRAMAKDPADRYPTAAEFGEDLLTDVAFGTRPVVITDLSSGPIISPPAPPEPTPVLDLNSGPIVQPPVLVGLDALTSGPIVQPPPVQPLVQAPVQAPVQPVVHPPAPAEPSRTAKKPGPPRRNRTKILLAVAGILAAGTAVTVLMVDLLGSNGSGQAFREPRASASASASPTSSAATVAKTCQEGVRELPAGASCGEPAGLAGLRFVFPQITSDCIGSRPETDKDSQYVCQVSGASVAYAAFRTAALARRHNDDQYDAPPTRLVSGLLRFGPQRMTDGLFQVSLMYDGTHPFAVDVSAGSAEQAARIANGLEVRAPSAFSAD